MTREDVFGLGVGLFVEDYFTYPTWPLRNAAAKSFEKKAPFNNNLPTQTGDVIVNPKNPVNQDSKPGLS
jgi:hypothetical protein